MRGTYTNMPKISNVKYKGINPKKKKAFIEETNEKIESFNSFWSKTMPNKIEARIDKLLKNDIKSLQILLKKNEIKLSKEEIKAAINSEDYEVNKPNAKIISKDISDEYCDELEDLLNEVTKLTPKKTLEEKTEKLDEFFNNFSENNPSKEIIEAADEKIGKLLAEEFEPLSEEKESKINEKLEAINADQEEIKKKLTTLINKLLVEIDRNNDMSHEDKRKSTSSLKRFKESFTTNKPSVVKKQDINVLKQITSALSAPDQKLKNQISKEQIKTKNVTNVEKNLETVTNQFTKIAENSKTSKPANVASSVETLSQKLNPKSTTKESPKAKISKTEVKKSEVETFEETLKNIRGNLKHTGHTLWKK